jgi:transcriptional regulator with XRE-family HTH domain
MVFTVGEKIRAVLVRRKMTLTELAQRTGQSRQNLSNKLNRNNFSDKELKEIAAALDCTFEPLFKLNDTGEEI